MKKFLFIAVLIWSMVSFAAVSGDHIGTSIKPGSYPPVHPDVFFQAEQFYTGTFSESSTFENIRGGVIPHHLVAHKLIARVFNHLKPQNPGTIILIGPNHNNEGDRIITSFQGWQTPFGVVNVDEKLLRDICLASPLIKQDDQIMGKEHAMGNIMPFIKYYLPETKVVPLIFHHNLTIDEASSLGKQLAALIDDNTVILASVDFSHYLMPDEAEEKDKETIYALKTWNLGRIFTMGDEYLDSPPSLGVLFRAMDKLGMRDFTVLNHTNSGVLLGNKNIETTSYITLLFGIEHKK
ncbi:MAG: AmmeMemoRadiSam system protein B [Bacillota bacterium]|jgi:AmmeMemoRadiSam system protein B|nr:AmmeMemoRadiSam system protein B [Clostridia bacterium]